MTSATIKLFLPRGDAKSLRTAEISNWTGKAANGFVVWRGSTAVLEERPSAGNYPYTLNQRKQLRADGTLVEKDGLLHFTRDVEFTSPSAAAVVIHGGSANGLIVWKAKDGRSLKQLDELS